MNESNEYHKNKWMQLPRNVVVGHCVINDTAGKVCKELKLTGSVLHVLTGGTEQV
jgi:glycerol-1-phosphate dehydrogenase [NAD(P)+]